MTGVLNITTQATYTDHAGVTWTYFQDNDTPNIFYITPVPAFALQNGLPQFHLTEYRDAQNNFVSAQCQMTTMLSVPSATIQAVQALLQQSGVSSPNYQAMDYLDIVTNNVDPNQASLHYADMGGTISRTVQTIPSLSGSQTAIFNINNMTQNEVNFFKAYFGGTANVGTIRVVYQLTVWAHMDDVTARVQFDSQAAYTYQRTFKWVR